MKNILKQLNNIQLGKPNSLLSFHTDGFSLHGALIHGGLTGQEIQATGSSRAMEFQTAVAEIMEQLKEQGVRKPPRRCLLVTASAVSALIGLPVPPDQPRPAAQMNELIRWEMEPIFALQNERWCIGALLMGRGYMQQHQRSEVMQEVMSRNLHSHQRITVRFGEVAQELGFVSRDQIDECLALQERLVQFDDEIVCGWAPQRREDDDQQDEESKRYAWLAVAIGDGLRKQWVTAFQRNGLFLEWIYPMLGAGFGDLPETGERDQMLVDVAQEQYALLRGRPGALQSLRVETFQNGELHSGQTTGLAHEEMRPDIAELYVNAAAATLEHLRPELEERLERKVIAANGRTSA